MKLSGSENRTSNPCKELLLGNAACVPADRTFGKGHSSREVPRETRNVPDLCPISRNNILVCSQRAKWPKIPKLSHAAKSATKLGCSPPTDRAVRAGPDVVTRCS
jgi:hypothetical protein